MIKMILALASLGHVVCGIKDWYAQPSVSELRDAQAIVVLPAA